MLLPPSIGQPCSVYERQQRSSQGLGDYGCLMMASCQGGAHGCSSSHYAAITEAGAHRDEKSVSVRSIALNTPLKGKVDTMSTLVTINTWCYTFEIHLMRVQSP